jgi:hypothetical protein
MEPVTTDPKGESRYDAANTSALAKEKRSRGIASYVTGFIDGEGSFLVSFSRRAALATGLEVRPSFSVSQHRRNRKILEKIRHFFGCGGIRFDRHDQTYKYEVRSLDDLWHRIIPHFKRYPLQTSKAKDFDRFVEVCSIMRTHRHRSREGLETILSIAYSMNNYGARKYELRNLLTIVRKMKV